MRAEADAADRRSERPLIAAARPRMTGPRALVVLRALQEFRLIFGSARRYDTNVRRFSGLPGSLLWALSEISRAGSLSVSGLAACMALHQTTASNLVNGLLERELIHRLRDAHDRRAVRLSVSAKGRQALRRAPHPHAGLLVDALERLHPRRLARLCRGLEGLVAEMQRADSKAAGRTLLGE